MEDAFAENLSTGRDSRARCRAIILLLITDSSDIAAVKALSTRLEFTCCWRRRAISSRAWIGRPGVKSAVAAMVTRFQRMYYRQEEADKIARRYRSIFSWNNVSLCTQLVFD